MVDFKEALKYTKINDEIKKLEKYKWFVSDWYHTFNELYDHRIALYIRLVNETRKKYNWHKSRLHHDWPSFDWWFIVMWYIDGKQVSYHLPDKNRDDVSCMEKEKSDKWDWHTSEDVVNRLLGK